MDVDITLEQAYQRYRPVKYRNEWWVDLGDRPRSFQSLRKAKEFIKRSHERRNRCLYTACLQEGEYMPGMGFGFRFCEKHTRNAKKALNRKKRR